VRAALGARVAQADEELERSQGGKVEGSGPGLSRNWISGPAITFPHPFRGRYASSVPLDLLVPDLLSSPESRALLSALRLPALERWVARADVSRLPGKTAVEILAKAFTLPSPPPVAAIALADDHAPREGGWVRADPVHLRVGQDAVALHDPAVLDITRDEADSLLEALRALFSADGLEFHAPSPERWYVRVPAGELPRTVPLQDAIGRNVFGMLPRGTGRINWAAALTEAQMLFAGHEVNARREAQGLPAINSVWFWGEGASPDEVASPYALVCSDDPFVRGLGRLSQARVVRRARSVEEVEPVARSEVALVVLDELTSPLRRGDAEAWRSAAARMEAGWFTNLGAAIGRFEAVRVILPAGGDTLVANIGPASRWRWYRTRKPLHTHA
jgi:hypothetical protein